MIRAATITVQGIATCGIDMAGSMCSLNAMIRAGSFSDNDPARIERKAP